MLNTHIQVLQKQKRSSTCYLRKNFSEFRFKLSFLSSKMVKIMFKTVNSFFAILIYAKLELKSRRD